MDARGHLARIEANGFPMTAGGDLAAQLVRQGLLTQDQAARGVAEYARFLALRATGAAVQPAPLVAEIWQEHLKDSAAYFDRFCMPVFGRPLHHAPTVAAVADSDPWRATLDAYRAAFGTAPPADIWPTPGRMRGLRVWEWIAAAGVFAAACGWILDRDGLFWVGAGVVLAGLIGAGLRQPVTMQRGSDAGG